MERWGRWIEGCGGSVFAGVEHGGCVGTVPDDIWGGRMRSTVQPGAGWLLIGHGGEHRE